MLFFTQGRYYITTALLLSFLQFHQVSQAQVRMRANLMIVDDNGMTLMDANMTNYGAGYSNLVDGNDIWKMNNFGENFGIIRQNANLVIERRSLINGTDTTYFRMWNMRQFHYRIQVIAENLEQNNLIGFVRDRYLNLDTPINLNDTSYVDFYVTGAAGSYAQNRFSLIYISNSAAALPVTFTGIRAVRKGTVVQISWESQNEVSLSEYVVERSYDGSRFTAIGSQLPLNIAGNRSYQASDVQYGTTGSYYRIKAISVGGKEQYSAIVHVGINQETTQLSVYPNPVSAKQLQLQVQSGKGEPYQVSLIHSNGKIEKLATLPGQTGTYIQTIQLPKGILAGVYQVQLSTPGKQPISKAIIVE